MLVRTKSDIELQNIYENLKREKKLQLFDAAKREYHDKVVNDFRKQLPSNIDLNDAKIFVISSRVLQGVQRCKPYELDEKEFAIHLFETAAKRRGTQS